MRTLIDGYNVMYAAGLLGKRMGSERFRKVRHRFLNDLADALGPVEASRTTIVFDASEPPAGFPKQSSHKGISVVFAVDAENADESIERLIAGHSTPKALTVVSTDLRIRQAASRRKSRAMTADEFLAHLDALRRQARRPSAPDPARPTAEEQARQQGPTQAEAAYWLDQFRDLDADPDTRAALGGPAPILTDDEIARLEREIDAEFGPIPTPPPGKGRPRKGR